VTNAVVANAVGVLGGTFDPVHNAHLAIARAALEQVAGRILWLPTGMPGYREAPVAAAQHRLAMLKLAVAGEARYAIDERELLPGASGFTFDSISLLRSENPGNRFVLIIGADQYEKRASWHRWPELERLCSIVVVARPGSKLDANVKTIPMTPSPVSASDIRARIGRGEDVSGMVPAAVQNYIRAKGLYR
jgi:nicotinate-nucleotide adenylyltransferase